MTQVAVVMFGLRGDILCAELGRSFALIVPTEKPESCCFIPNQPEDKDGNYEVRGMNIMNCGSLCI